MTRIKQSDVMAPAMKLMAESWVRSLGYGRVRVARVYRLQRTRDGSGAEEYLLARGESGVEGPVSMLLKVEGTGYQMTFQVHKSAARKAEGKMINAWYDAEGALRDGL